MFFHDQDLRLWHNEGWAMLDLRAVFKYFTGLKVSFHPEACGRGTGSHLTCISMSNKGLHVLLGYADGSVQKRNLKYELLKSYKLEPHTVVKACLFNDNDSIILVAQGRRVLSLRAESFEFIKDFLMREDIEALDTWHGYLYVGMRSAFEIVK